MSREVIFEQTVEGFSTELGLGYAHLQAPPAFSLVSGKTYTVLWGEDTFTDLQAYDAEIDGAPCVYVGDGSALNYPGNGEPFAIICFESFNLFSAFYDETQSRTIGIYLVEENYNPNDAVILNYSQTPVRYEKIPKVWLTHPSSAEETPVLVPFTYGEAASKTVEELDFSEGPMFVPIEAGQLITELTINQPADLVPEKIAEGEYIAGIGPGTHKGGDAEVPALPTAVDDWLYDVCFWDIDGSLLLHLPVADAANLEVLPVPPDKTDLVFVGWNHTLEEIRTLNRPLDIGAVYDTAAPRRVIIKLNITNSSYRAVPVHFSQTVANGVTINWGDGTTSKSSATGATSLTHTYSTTGVKTIIMTVVDGCDLTLGGGTSSTCFIGGNNSTYRSYATQIYASSGIKLSAYCLYSLSKLEILVFPPDLETIPDYTCYYNCIKCLVLPPSLRTVGSTAFNTATGSYTNRNFSPLCIPESAVDLRESCFTGLSYLYRIVLPTAITSLPKRCCHQHRCLRLVVMPPNLESLGEYCFAYCEALEHIDMPKTVTSIGAYCFYYCRSLRELELPEGITEIPNSLVYECTALSKINVPSTVTTIGNYFLYRCCGPTELDLPEGITHLGNYFLTYSTVRRLIVRGKISTTGSYVLNNVDALKEIIFLVDTTVSAMAGRNLYIMYYVPDAAIDNFKAVFSSDYDYGIRPLSSYKGQIPGYTQP